MTELEFKGIFSRFENLNLLILMEDLRQNRVARRTWRRPRSQDICPLGHGCRGKVYHEAYTVPHWAGVAGPQLNVWEANLGVHYASEPYEEATAFVKVWDAGMRRSRLLRILTDIYNERLADADVVQGVCAAQPEPQPA